MPRAGEECQSGTRGGTRGTGWGDHAVPAGWCLIQGARRADGDTDAANVCLSCDASARTQAWTANRNR